MIKATIEIDNGAHVVLLQDEEGNKMVTSVLPLLDMIKSGKEIEVEGDNVVSKEVRHYQLNLKENEDIVKGIKGRRGFLFIPTTKPVNIIYSQKFVFLARIYYNILYYI